MTIKNCILPHPDDEFDKKSHFEAIGPKQKELGKRQREYKKILSTKLKSRKETIMESSYQNTIDQLMIEKNTLRAQIWVAEGATYRQQNQRYLTNIKCHVECQEKLLVDIRSLKTSIVNLEKEISRVNKQVYELNRKTVPDSQHVAFVAQARKEMYLLENQLEVGVRRECGFTAVNASLREELVCVLRYRTYFNETYTKLIQRLNSDKKYLIDLIEYAFSTFDNCVDLYEKMANINKRQLKERDSKKLEMQSIMRTRAAELDKTEFLDSKIKQRKLDDIQPKEYRRRERFRRIHNKKIKIYSAILGKILDYTNSSKVEDVIEKYQQQESLYYSYFNYANEMSYHMTILNNSVNRLYTDISLLKIKNRETLEDQVNTIEKLEAQLKAKQKKNEALHSTRIAHDESLKRLLEGFSTIFRLCNADATPLQQLLGNHEDITGENAQKYMKILENRIYEVTAAVYMLERSKGEKIVGEYTVRQLDRLYDNPTPLNNIVLAQQCPECAEGEAFNLDDAGDGVFIQSIDETKRKLYEKINQPEMQYRLHSISQCRLPRSRILAAKRNL